MSLSIPIKYNFSDFNNITQYLFILTINDNLKFKNIENNKYSHLIKLNSNITKQKQKYLKKQNKKIRSKLSLLYLR